jgi:hypothetical protein
VYMTQNLLRRDAPKSQHQPNGVHAVQCAVIQAALCPLSSSNHETVNQLRNMDTMFCCLRADLIDAAIDHRLP